MGYASPADLNAYAAVAQDYEEIAFHTADPGSDPDAFLAEGGGPYDLTMATAGGAGPSDAQPATDGRTYSGSFVADLEEAATWASLRVAGVVRRTFPLSRGAIGPGSIPLVYGLAVANKS